MKVAIYVLISIVLFLFVFSFIVQNPHDIKIHYYFGIVWDGPMATPLLLTLGVGIPFGVLASCLSLLKMKLRLVKVTNEARALQSNYSLERSQVTRDNI